MEEAGLRSNIEGLKFTDGDVYVVGCVGSPLIGKLWKICGLLRTELVAIKTKEFVRSRRLFEKVLDIYDRVLRTTAFRLREESRNSVSVLKECGVPIRVCRQRLRRVKSGFMLRIPL